MADRGVDFTAGDNNPDGKSTAQPGAARGASGPIDFPDGMQAQGIAMNEADNAMGMPPTGSVRMESPADK